MATSALPNAITQLLAILRARPALQDGVLILDGPPTGDVSRADLIAVGWSTEEDQAGELVQNFNAAGARTRDEDFSIAGVIDTWSGDAEFAVVRERVFALLGEVEDALRASSSSPEAPTLNGAVLWAHLTRGVLRQYNTDSGVRAALTFTVTCHARI